MSKIRLGVRSWSFRMFLPNGGMDVKNFLKTAAEMGLEGVELLARHCEDFREETIQQYQHVAKCLGIEIAAIALENDFCFPDERVREGELQNAYMWIRLCAAAKIPFLKIFTGDTDPAATAQQQLEWLKGCLVKVAEYAKAYGVVVLVENHSPLCFDWPELKALVTGIDHPSLQICPDFYNFSKYKAEEVVYEAAKELIPLSPYSHLQFYEMDETGRELHMDMPRLIQIYKDLGFDGFLMLEWEGNSDPNPATQLQADYIRTLL